MSIINIPYILFFFVCSFFVCIKITLVNSFDSIYIHFPLTWIEFIFHHPMQKYFSGIRVKYTLLNTYICNIVVWWLFICSDLLKHKHTYKYYYEMVYWIDNLETWKNYHLNGLSWWTVNVCLFALVFSSSFLIWMLNNNLDCKIII